MPGLDWVSALRRPAIQQLVEAGSLDLTRLVETAVLEFTDPIYARERLIACRNPLLALERARKREALLQATERELDAIVQATTHHTPAHGPGGDCLAGREGTESVQDGQALPDRDHRYAAAVYP